MVKKKSEEKKEKTVPKKTTKPKIDVGSLGMEIKQFSISELLQKHKIKPLDAVGFLNYYGLTEEFKNEFETNEVKTKFSDGEFSDMFERYMKRGI